MKITKKLLSIIIAILVLAVTAIIGIMIIKSSNKKAIITTSTLREVISISELSTGEFCYNGVVSVPKKDKPEKTDYSIKYDSTIKAGIDAKDVDFKIDNDNKTITPILPEIVINDVSIDEKSISAIPEDATAKLKDALKSCEEDAIKEANQNNELIETAKSNLKDSITALLTPLIKEAGYTIVW